MRPSRFIISPEISFSLRGKYRAAPLRSHPLSSPVLPSWSSRIPRKRGYPSIWRRVPIANEKSCSVAFNSMCRATRATISTRSINRVSCARISISGCLVDEHLYSRFLFDLKGISLSFSLLRENFICVFISSRCGITCTFYVDLHFNDRLGARRKCSASPIYFEFIMFCLHGNNFVKAISRVSTYALAEIMYFCAHEISTVIEYSEICRVVCV